MIFFSKDIIKLSREQFEQLVPVFRDALHGINDVKDLANLTNGAVLNTVRVRYTNQKEIHTFCDSVIIVINHHCPEVPKKSPRKKFPKRC